MTVKTPGVYVKEISIFPPSVAEVETAIPAFIGYTQMAEKKGESLRNKPTKISSLLEYIQYFGNGPSPGNITVDLKADNSPQKVTIVPRFYMFHSLQLFFANGGGDCYIVSVGDFTTQNTIQNGDVTDSTSYGFMFGLNALEKYDEPTIILFPDAVLLPNSGDLYSLQQAALKQCEKLQDRVAVFDLFEKRASDATFDWEAGVQEFRDKIGVNSLKYGAAYVPYLRSTVPYSFDFSNITTVNKGGAPVNLEDLTPLSASLITAIKNALLDKATLKDFIENYDGSGNTIIEEFEQISSTGEANITDKITFMHDLATAIIALPALQNGDLNTELTNLKAAGTAPEKGPLETLVRKLLQYDVDYYDGNVAAPGTRLLGVFVDGDYTYDMSDISSNADVTKTIYHSAGLAGDDENAKASNANGPLRSLAESMNALITGLYDAANLLLLSKEQELKDTNSIYANIVLAINGEGSVVPPSGAMAGVYANVDRIRGVWKSPANVSLNSVNEPTVMIDHFDQNDLNIDVNAGKSINAVRAFSGKGTLVWGARTLAGNDNEWRYVSVRRFFNMVEESVKKSTGWAVFEPNDANTWTKVKTMIDNYLIQKWREGALQGATPEDAFFVKVGLGLTMTAQDILEGKMNVEIGMAVVRPAEFIILKFSHKMVES